MYLGRIYVYIYMGQYEVCAFRVEISVRIARTLGFKGSAQSALHVTIHWLYL